MAKEFLIDFYPVFLD